MLRLTPRVVHAVLLAVLAVTGLSACGEQVSTDTSSAPSIASSATPSAESTSAESTSDSVLSEEDLESALRALAAADTGRFHVSTDSAGGSSSGHPLAVDTEGMWSFESNAGSTSSRANAEGGPMEIKQLLLDGDAYVQVLYEDSPWAPDCWTLSASAPDSAGYRLPSAIAAVLDVRTQTVDGRQQNTALLSDVLGAIGMQKSVNFLSADVVQARVPVSLVVEAGAIEGWEVSSGVLQPYMVEVAEAQGLSRQVMSEAFADLAWSVEFSAVGEPVTIAPPGPDKLIEAGGPECGD